MIADHVRTLSFAIADGAVPSNEGRGYVLRRILRRAVRYGVQTLGAQSGFFSQLVPVLVREMGGAYPELRAKQAQVTAIISEEEASFSALLQRGVKYFNELVEELNANGKTEISGDKAFFMYDTMGFPVDLTQIMAAERGISVDLAGFQQAMQEQKERSRVAGRAKRLEGRQELTLGAEQTAHLQSAGILPTDDGAKYNWDADVSTTVQAIYTSSGFVESVGAGTAAAGVETVGIVLENTPFYAEAGGQAADSGTLTVALADGSSLVLEVIDVQVLSFTVL